MCERMTTQGSCSKERQICSQLKRRARLDTVTKKYLEGKHTKKYAFVQSFQAFEERLPVCVNLLVLLTSYILALASVLMFLVRVVSFKYSLALYSVQIWLRFTAARRPFMTLLEKQGFIASAPDMGRHHPVSFPPFVIMQILIHSPHSTSFKTHQGCHQYSL